MEFPAGTVVSLMNNGACVRVTAWKDGVPTRVASIHDAETRFAMSDEEQTIILSGYAACGISWKRVSLSISENYDENSPLAKLDTVVAMVNITVRDLVGSDPSQDIIDNLMSHIGEVESAAIEGAIEAAGEALDDCLDDSEDDSEDNE